MKCNDCSKEMTYITESVVKGLCSDCNHKNYMNDMEKSFSEGMQDLKEISKKIKVLVEEIHDISDEFQRS